MKFELKLSKEKKAKVPQSSTTGFMRPTRDWTIGLSLAALLFVTGVGYLAFDFYQQFVVPNEGVVAEAEPVVYREKDVYHYAEFYDEKEETFIELRNQRVPLPAPEETPPPMEPLVEE